uniref:Uncharacterized protein n=1 Tax=Paramoeba aestuarina TaxID=180227 RepID=A0A7S4NZS8_9EUKA|mmetsp:Transcript_33793/g.52869  ORF Transcript_33793/g.52869 Transcript_33793/m.52869 type:complete len:291 (+) Transcript_33793:7-879(+)
MQSITSFVLLVLALVAVGVLAHGDCHSSGKTEASVEAKEVVLRIRDAVDASSLLHHDFLECYAKGGFKDMAVATRLFAINHYAYSRNFIQYLTQVRDKLAAVSPDDVELISENMDEENGNYAEEDYEILAQHDIKRELVEKVPHKVLIKHFLETVGVRQEDFDDQTTIGAIFTQDILKMYDEANACEALAIIGFSIEQTVSTLYKFIWEGLKSHTDLNPDDYVFFPLHILIDDGHAEHIQDAFAALYTHDPEMCANAPSVVKNVLDRREQMFTDLKAHVEEEVGGKICPE